MKQTRLTWEYGLSTHIGSVKQCNEDNSFLKILVDPLGNEFILAIVADGMGGYQGGDVASKTVINAIDRWVVENHSFFLTSNQPFLFIAEAMERLLHETNQKLINYGKQYGKKLGTTVSILFLYKGRFLIVHVGDCRIYQLERLGATTTEYTGKLLYDQDETVNLEGELILSQLTEDHTWIEMKVKQGVLSREEARNHPKRNILMQCIGIENPITPFVKEGSYHANNLFILCSDGFYELLLDRTILSLAMLSEGSKQNLQLFSEQLVNIANESGATDNITVTLVKALPEEFETSWKGRIVELFKS
ncbi:PP2C family protein-serine/threonine phosphatase [Aquibacillus rhizosphaerae]|uniref:Protein phosphatase 2C domain-containing protein n=1 Tax=Aquibacillus rhizosphaerae TaxID=3051431 RepID=A0ABT7KZL2_9BACI|nr:protein phosphatase 2C domain-containing protein [Aquibacillus sp. LR5S19]MDL4838921.1 protein phosphatase 2C domain-containing protein [Aquibacillus sp. LR5S19]